MKPILIIFTFALAGCTWSMDERASFFYGMGGHKVAERGPVLPDPDKDPIGFTLALLNLPVGPRLHLTR